MDQESLVGVEEILAQRGEDYGSFIDGAFIMQSIKQIMFDSPNWKDLWPDQKESMEMFASKIGRLLNGDPDHLDSWRDIEGYARLVTNRLKGEDNERQ